METTNSVIRFRRKPLHTIVSREIIKPSFPTPSHLKTYNLSVFDQITPNEFIPMVTFYPNMSVYPNSRDKMHDLKNSLSQTLTKYYPFAGRYAKTAPTYVDCNDYGAEFLEASVNQTLTDFLQNSQHEDLDQFVPFGRIWENVTNDFIESDHVVPLAVQVNRFECGGVAVAVSISHKIADSSSVIHFLNDWAKLTRLGKHKFGNDPIESPHFINFRNTSINFSGLSFETSHEIAIRTFIFPNSKLNDLKLKVKSESSVTNPTRVEVLTWLLSKCAMNATTKNNSGTFRPSGVISFINIRDKIIERLPEKTVGNMLAYADVQIESESEIMNPEYLISQLKKQKTALGDIKDIEMYFEHVLSNFSQDAMQQGERKINEYYVCSSMCGFHAYEIDFGWGKPIKTTFAGSLGKDSFILMDTPNGDGIEAIVCLEKQDMDIVQTDPELLAFC